MNRRRLLFLGASGFIGPHVTPGLEADYDLRLADLKPHPQGIPVLHVDITDYAQVLEAARGTDAIMNFTVNRGHPVQSFAVNVLGAWNVMRAAAELGIGKVVHTGPQTVMGAYAHDFDVDDPPGATGADYYGLTKLLSREICRTWARAHGIQTVCFLFCYLTDRPQRTVGQDFHVFHVIYEDVVRACRLALEAESVPDCYQDFSLLSFEGHGKYNVNKARRILGFEPAQRWEELFRRTP
ncbi:MAG: NAD(P)-dependent oxidoreductase [Candidatus Latescibacterota bacterium]